jgi:predicted metallopeptidase
VGAKRKYKPPQKRTPAPVEIADAEHELVIERAAAIDFAKASGKVCVRLPGTSGRRVSRIWGSYRRALPRCPT